MGASCPKQFLPIGERAILQHTLLRFGRSRLVDYIVIVTEPSSIKETTKIVTNAGLSKEWKVVAGGEKRQDSVRCGINALPPETEIVVVHDGVRPFIESSLIDKSVEITRKEGGCIVAIPISDTVKLSAGEDAILKTIDRTHLWAAQTPQTFRYKLLKEAFDRAYADNFYGTDEASLVERIGKRVVLLKGSRTNIKITTPEDLEIAGAILNRTRSL